MDKPVVDDKAIFCHLRWLLSGKTIYLELEPELWKAGVEQAKASLAWSDLSNQQQTKRPQQ